MTASRTLAVVSAVVAVPLLVNALAAGPAAAHGGLEDPVSRSAGCGPEGRDRNESAACQAAGGNQAFEHWDNVRLPDVNGRDREVVPDGRLCSAGIQEFSGLDAPRSDWPTTTLTAGADYTFRYRGTIPHKGTFRIYVTKDGYDASQPLRWSALESDPFLSVTDPPLSSGSYSIAGRLPEGKTGRHVVYTIWQNADTPDTYYSCSDVIFKAPAGQPGVGDPAGDGAARNPGQGNAGADRALPAADLLAGEMVSGGGSSEPASAQRVTKVSQRTGIVSMAALLAVGFAAAAAIATAGVAIVRRRRTPAAAMPPGHDGPSKAESRTEDG